MHGKSCTANISIFTQEDPAGMEGEKVHIVCCEDCSAQSGGFVWGFLPTGGLVKGRVGDGQQEDYFRGRGEQFDCTSGVN